MERDMFGKPLPRGDSVALLDGATGERLTRDQAARVVDRIAARFLDDGVKAGDSVVLRTPTTLPAVLSCRAIWGIGAVVVPLDPDWPAYLLNPVLEQVRPRLLLDGTDPLPGYGGKRLHLSDNEGLISAEFLSWLDETPSSRMKRDMSSPVHEADPGAILFTSGSTGVPKGVVLGRGALARSARLIVEQFGWRGDDSFLNLGELHTMSGLRNSCLATAACGASLLLVPPSRRSDIFALSEVLARFQPTILGTGPMIIHMVRQLRDRLEATVWQGLRQVVCTGGFLPTTDAREFLSWAGHPVVNYYGLTETTGLCIAHTPATAAECDETLGRPVGAECLIIDESGRELPTGEAGELVICGPNLMRGYLGRPDLTAEVLRGGRLYTGDRALVRPDGRIVLVGRIRHYIKTASTELIFPEEIEVAIMDHDAIADAGAVGVPSEDTDGTGDRLVVFIVPRGEITPAALAEQLHVFLRKRLGPHRLPHGYRTVDHIPRHGNGKIDRRALLEFYHDNH